MSDAKNAGYALQFMKANEDAKASGVMIALSVPMNIANQLVLPGGESAADLHITLAYLGKSGTLPDNFLDALKQVVADLASEHDPIICKVAGISMFSATEHSDGKDVIYATVESASLIDFRNRLIDKLVSIGIPARTDFEYTPHITLKYVDPGETLLAVTMPNTMIVFEEVCIEVGPSRITFPFEKEFSKAEHKTNLVVKFKGNDPERRLVFGWASIAKTPDGEVVEDWQGDTIRVPELEKTAYKFVKNSRQAGEMHDIIGVGTLVESMVFTKEKIDLLKLPADKVPLGWWVGFEVTQDVFDKVKDGTYRAFSIGGRGIRRKIGD